VMRFSSLVTYTSSAASCVCSPCARLDSLNAD